MKSLADYLAAAVCKVRAARRPALWILAGLVLSTCAVHAQQAEKSKTEGARRMAQRMAKIIANANPPEMYYTVGHDARVARIYEQLAVATDVSAQLSLHMKLAYEFLKEGHTEKAIKKFKEVRRAFERPDIRASAKSVYQLGQLLAASYLRLGEQQNCLDQHGPDSCLMPIKGGGVHTKPEGSRKAIHELESLLTVNANDLGMRWLLNLAYMTVGEHPDGVPKQWLISKSTFKSDYDLKRFPNIAKDVGLDVLGLSGGVVLEDFNLDGDLDLMMSSWGLKDQMQYFVNNGDGSFSNKTKEAGLLGETGGLNLRQADYNNDGYADVFVLRGAWLRQAGRHPNSLLRNNGDGTFSDVTEEAGLLSFHPTQAAAWGDYNLDGLVDLFIGNESATSSPHPCELYRNSGDGTFSNVAGAAGVANVGFVKAVAWGDYDNDGRPDLYLSRLMESNVLYRNAGPRDGTWAFEDVSAASGADKHRPSFSTWFFDFDNDGWEDIFVASFPGFLADSLGQIAADYMGSPRIALAPAMFRNQRDGTFVNVTDELRLNRMMLVMGANYGDLDNDGYLDLYLGTGEPYMTTLVPNRLYRNAAGRIFQNVTTSGGFGHLQKGHGIAFGDIDNDGDQDVYAVMGGAYAGDVAYNALYLNPGNGNRWVTLQLEGVQANRLAIGARIRVVVESASGQRSAYVTVGSGGSFGSSSVQQEIGLGDAQSIARIEIEWPGQRDKQIFENVSMDHAYRIRQGGTTMIPVTLKPIKLRAD